MQEAYAAEVACLQKDHQACSGPRQQPISPAAGALPAAQSPGLNSRQPLPGSLACQTRSTHIVSEQQRAIHQIRDVSMPCNGYLAAATAASAASTGPWVPGQGAAAAIAATREKAQSISSGGKVASVNLVCGYGSGNSSASSGKSTVAVCRSSAVRPAAQHQARARAGNNSMSRLSEEAGPAGRAASKVLTPGQKRQALCELGPQRMKHSQKDMPAWTQGTDDSDF